MIVEVCTSKPRGMMHSIRSMAVGVTCATGRAHLPSPAVALT